MRRRLGRARAAVVATLLVALTLPSSAEAIYANPADGAEGAQLVSADYNRLEQGDDTTRYAAISADGRYVAIETIARNFFADDDPDPIGDYRVGGIFRFDLQTRALVKVADGNRFRESDNAFLVRGASNPSISADGRYVAFSTGEQLAAADVNDNVDIYVRDMTLLPGVPGAYVLASARDGSETPAGFGPPPFSGPGSDPGAELSAGVAISADGSRVAFRTELKSDLPAEATADTPAGQIFVRDLNAQTTTLVTSLRNSGTGLMGDGPAGGALGAALSADGTTVAWTGRNAAGQTRFLGGENIDPSFNYYLWRRAPFGPTEATRRITGLADPDDPVCLQMETENPSMVTIFTPDATGPCFGPLTDQESNRADISSQLPALSSDGYSVAFLTGSGPRPPVQSGPGLDLYLTDMRPGVTRKQGTTELTRETSAGDIATSAALNSVAMSPDGRYLAVTTSRTKFALPALQLTGSTRTVPGPPELYVVDLQTRTLERVTRSALGGDVDSGVLDAATISSGGDKVAFSSFAGNLFRGDANQRADAFVATRLPNPTGGAGGTGGGEGQSSIQVQRSGPRVLVRAKAKANGIVVLTISVPAAGSIEAVATGKFGKPPKPQTIATRKTHARGRGSLNVVIRAATRFHAALDRGTELKARVKVTFRPSAGGKRLHAGTVVTFKD